GHVRGVGACGHRLCVGRDVRVLHPPGLARLVAEPEHGAVRLGQKRARLLCGRGSVATLTRGNAYRRNERERRESSRTHGAIIEAPLTSGKGGGWLDKSRMKRTDRVFSAVARHHPGDTK